jgi:hypothetical protein
MKAIASRIGAYVSRKEPHGLSEIGLALTLTPA